MCDAYTKTAKLRKSTTKNLVAFTTLWHQFRMSIFINFIIREILFRHPVYPQTHDTIIVICVEVGTLKINISHNIQLRIFSVNLRPPRIMTIRMIQHSCQTPRSLDLLHNHVSVNVLSLSERKTLGSFVFL